MLSHKITTEAANLPVALSTVKSYLRVTGSDDDALITSLIKTSNSRLRTYCKRSFQTLTHEFILDCFHAERIYLPMPPLVAVTAIYYYSADDTENTFSSAKYRVDTTAGAVVLDNGQTWPTIGRDYAGVKIVYTAGYGTAEASVPDAIQNAIMIDTARLYESRGEGCEISPMVKDILSEYKLEDRLAMAPNTDRTYWNTAYYGL